MTAVEWTVPATVLRVVDGDTVHLELDLGWHVTYTASCRIAGINAPELSTPEGQRAKAFAIGALPEGAQVVFRSKRLDKYGRPLGEILLGPDRRPFSEAMLAAGLAVPFMT